MLFASLRTRSHFSFLQGASAPEQLCATAAQLGYTALALTDVAGVFGAVRHERACRSAGLHAIIGTEIELCGVPVSAIACNNHGYAELCRIINNEICHKQCEHVLWILHATNADTAAVRTAMAMVHNNVYLGVEHTGKPGATRAARRVVELANSWGIPAVVAQDVRYAVPEDAATLDLMTCIRLGITIHDVHEERIRHNRNCLLSIAELQTLLPWPELFDTCAEIVERCSFRLLPDHITPPAARVPPGTTAPELLRTLCTQAIPRLYQEHMRPQALQQMNHELHVIEDLGLADFFLVVHEVTQEARRRGIRHSGRGSAANAIVAYLLGITRVCPLRHNLLFERFLHRGRKGTPDIDVDFDSERRPEIIAWMEERFGHTSTAMTATLITYRMRMAVRDAAKSLGWPMDTVNAMSKVIPHYTTHDVQEYRAELAQVCGDVPMVDVLVRAVGMLLDHPRHLGQHSGGMILAQKELWHFSPVQKSANGVTVVQFDKDDVEAMGLVKFDVLGLRMLACISETLEHIAMSTGTMPDLDAIPLDDEETFQLIRSGNTLGVFQIESQGQMHLLAKHQPQVFNDLVTEVALFRPGPLQGGMVHPYIARRNGRTPITYPHPLLESILKDTLGIVLFQEQVLEIAHHFAGMTLEEADDFRALVSKNRSRTLMENMRARFIQGAMHNGVSQQDAENVYTMVSHFVGYGFCRSHAAAFARIVYESAWLKTHHTAAYMAAFMQHRPGMYNLTTLEQECKRFGVQVLPPCINNSSVRYRLENVNGTMAIRKPLTSITGCSAEVAASIEWERSKGAFTSVADVVQRCPNISSDVFDAIGMSGAFSVVDPHSRRSAWIAGVVKRRRTNQPPPLFEIPAFNAQDVPELAVLTAPERLAYDYQMQGAARHHPITLYRRMFSAHEVRAINIVQRLPGDGSTRITTAGIVILRQSPPTAHGVLFVTIEDETGFMQCIVRPHIREQYRTQLKSSMLILRGVVHGTAQWRGLLVEEVVEVERQRETERRRYRETERQRDRETERQRD